MSVLQILNFLAYLQILNFMAYQHMVVFTNTPRQSYLCQMWGVCSAHTEGVACRMMVQWHFLQRIGLPNTMTSPQVRGFIGWIIKPEGNRNIITYMHK